MARAYVLGHCSRCGSPPVRRSGIPWCQKCNEEIKGQPSPFGPADKEAVSPGGRRKIPTQRDDA